MSNRQICPMCKRRVDMSRESRHLRMAMYDGKWVHESCAEQPGRYPRLEPSNVTPQGRTAVRQALESGHLGKRP